MTGTDYIDIGENQTSIEKTNHLRLCAKKIVKSSTHLKQFHNQHKL